MYSYVSYLILFSDLMQKCKKCGLAVADFFSGISWDPMKYIPDFAWYKHGMLDLATHTH